MGATREKPLVFRRGSDALEFPARPAGDTINPPALFSHPIVSTDEWEGVGSAIFDPGTGAAANLPAGWSGRWDVADDGRLETTIRFAPAHWGHVLTLAGKICPGVDVHVDIVYTWTAVDGHPPLPSGSHSLDIGAIVGPDALEPTDPAAWVPFEDELEIYEGAATLTIQIDALPDGSGPYTGFTGLEVNGDEPDDAVVWACLPAHDQHLEGLWSLPAMLGEIEENILYGGGLAPDRPKYGPRPVTYRLFGSAGSRAALNADLRRIMAFLAEGRIETDNNGYGFTRDGFLAAPPSVEWADNGRYQVTVSLVVTYLDPAIYGAAGADLTDAAAWIDQPYPASTRGLDYTGHYTWRLPTSGEGLPRAVLTLTNGGTMPIWPWIYVYLSGGPYTVDDRSGFAIWATDDLETPVDEIEHGSLAGSVVWYAADHALGARWVMYSPASGQAYTLDGQLIPKWAECPDYGGAQRLLLEPGQTLRYIIGAHGAADTPGVPPTMRDGSSAALAVFATY